MSSYERLVWLALFFLLARGAAAKDATGHQEDEDAEDDDSLPNVSTVNLDDMDFTGTSQDVAFQAMSAITQNLEARMAGLFEKTKTPECRQLIAHHFGYFTEAIASEKALPFSDVKFNNSCEGGVEWDFDNLPEGVHMGTIQNLTYQPPRNETEYISSSEVRFVYGILAHDSAQATIRLIEAVDEPTTQFLVHIDAKYDDTHRILKEHASTRPKITVLDHPYRCRVNWGGFSMVNATMQLLHFADQMDFTHFVHVSSSTYPIASNRRIRNTVAAYPKDANFLNVILKPATPHPGIWNYYVECDDRVHRIYRLTPHTKEANGADLFTSSQWFVASKEFAHYLANPEPGSFVQQYLEYNEHALVADEAFFGTVIRNTAFCHKHHNWNFLHLTFDQWENEQDIESRDERKCVMPDPNHCGRSPTTLTLDYLDILEMSKDLFARKFSDADIKIKDVIDTLRFKEEFHLTSLNITEPKDDIARKVNMSLEGYGTLIVARETVDSDEPLCLGLGPVKNKVRLVPCFHEDVVPTLAPGWETGGVILEETQPHNRFEIGPCSSDGNLKRLGSGEVEVTEGLYTTTGPRCMLRMMDGIRTGRCVDGEALDRQPGGPSHVYPCTKQWSQFFSFGNGRDAPAGSLHITVPLHTRERIKQSGREQEPYMCLGVKGRGDLDEEDWFGERGEDEEASSSGDSEDDSGKAHEELGDEDTEEDGWDALEEDDLQRWVDRQLVTTRCSNTKAIIEWVLVPFIIDEDDIEIYDGQKESLNNKTSEDGSEDEEL